MARHDLAVQDYMHVGLLQFAERHISTKVPHRTTTTTGLTSYSTTTAR